MPLILPIQKSKKIEINQLLKGNYQVSSGTIQILCNLKILDFVATLLRSDLRVTTAKLKGLRIGEPWRFVMRHLHLTDAEIENKHEEYINKGGIEEVRLRNFKITAEDSKLFFFAGDLPAFENVVRKKWF